MSKYIINNYKNWINYNGRKIGSLTVLGYTPDKKWECKSCGEIHDRDLNASKNIIKSARVKAVKQTLRLRLQGL